MMDARKANKKSLSETVQSIIQKEGYSGFYRGVHVSLARVVPNCCITFVCYEMFLRWSKDYLERRGSI